MKGNDLCVCHCMHGSSSPNGVGWGGGQRNELIVCYGARLSFSKYYFVNLRNLNFSKGSELYK